MRVRTTIAGAGLSAVLSVVGCGAMTIVVSAAVSACSGSSTSTPEAGGTSFSSEPSTAPNGGVTTETVTANPATATSNPTASPVTAAPATGGGGTAGTEDAPLFVIGGVAVLAGAGSLAYRRRVTRNR
jgi:LPXTG-motif cell wall-anchored protein